MSFVLRAIIEIVYATLKLGIQLMNEMAYNLQPFPTSKILTLQK